LWGSDLDYLPQSSSASRRTASLAGFFDLSQSGERSERYGDVVGAWFRGAPL